MLFCVIVLLLAGTLDVPVNSHTRKPGHPSIPLPLDTYSTVLPGMQEESAARAGT